MDSVLLCFLKIKSYFSFFFKHCNITELRDSDITYLLENSYVLDTALLYTTSIIFIESANCYPEASFSFTFILQVGWRRHKTFKQLVHIQLVIPKLLGWELKRSSTQVKLLTVTHHHHSDHPQRSLCHLHEPYTGLINCSLFYGLSVYLKMVLELGL